MVLAVGGREISCDLAFQIYGSGVRTHRSRGIEGGHCAVRLPKKGVLYEVCVLVIPCDLAEEIRSTFGGKCRQEQS